MRKTIGTTLILGAICSLMFTVNNAECFAEEGLAAYWSMDEGQGDVIKDKSSNGNDGKIHGAVWVEGKFGKALKFNGTDNYVDCGNDSSLNITDAVTIEFWVKINEIGDTCWAFIQKGNRLDAWSIWYWSGELPAFQIDFSKSPIERKHKNERCHTSMPAGSIPVGEWAHVAAVYDGQYIKGYVNGIEKASKDVGSYAILTNAYPVKIGWKEVKGAKSFNGIMDEVRIWNRALSKEEIEKRALGKQMLVQATILRSSLSELEKRHGHLALLSGKKNKRGVK